MEGAQREEIPAALEVGLGRAVSQKKLDRPRGLVGLGENSDLQDTRSQVSGSHRD